MLLAMATIYALCDPDTEEVRYIGKTSSVSLYDRLKVHIFRAQHSTKSHRLAWIRGLLNQEKRPSICGLELIGPGIDWREREKWWIKFARGQGCKLTNMTEGGDGVEGLVCTPERREQVRQQMLGNQYGKGHKWTPEQRKKMMVSRTHETMSARTQGSKHPRAELTEEDVYEILTRLSNGEKAKSLAEEYPVAYVTIRGIACRNSWRHVQWP